MTADIVFLPSIVLPGSTFSRRAAKKSATSTEPIVRFSGFFVFPVCIFEGLCYITHHSLRMRDEVLEVKVNKI